MANRIIFTDKTFTGGVQGVIKYDGRECYKFTLTASYTDIIKYFKDGAAYVWEYDTVIDDIPNVVTKDLTALDFVKAGKIIVSEDRKTFEVYMGKKTVDEELVEVKAELVTVKAELEAVTKI